MTLSIAWLRMVGSVEELVFASDSRLRSGEAWDCCPKIMTLPRSDCLISFAGSTAYAYPLMLQMARAIEFYPASSDRRVDIADLRGHTLRVFNQMRGLIHDFPMQQMSAGDPETGFLFGGYSWREREFLVWVLKYDKGIDSFVYQPVKKWPGQTGRKKIAFIGDSVADARHRLVELLRERGKMQVGGFNMEPFEILRDMIRSNRYPTIGGAPQVARVYRYMQTRHFTVRWPTNDGLPHALGRPALDYEKFAVPAIEPDSPEAHSRAGRMDLMNLGVEHGDWLPDDEDWSPDETLE